MRVNKNKGFTLIEMMITVAIISILVAIAYPSYQNYIVRANRSAAQQFMLRVVNQQEQYMLDARSYTATIGDGGLGLEIPTDVSSYYTVTIVDLNNAATPPVYTVQAVAKAGTMQAGEPTLTINSVGIKAPASEW